MIFAFFTQLLIVFLLTISLAVLSSNLTLNSQRGATVRERLIVSDYGELPNLTSYLFSSAGVAVNASSCNFSRSSWRFDCVSFS